MKPTKARRVRTKIRHDFKHVATIRDFHGGVCKKKFGQELKRALRTAVAYDILGAHGTWTSGGCWTLAAALQEFLGYRSRLIAITANGSDIPQHLAVELDGICYDADGASSEPVLLRRWRTLERVVDPCVVEFDAAMAKCARRAGIPFSKRKAQLLKTVFDKITQLGFMN